MTNENWFKDESIIAQEVAVISDGKTQWSGVSLIVGSTEIIMGLDELKSVVKFLEDE